MPDALQASAKNSQSSSDRFNFDAEMDLVKQRLGQVKVPECDPLSQRMKDPENGSPAKMTTGGIMAYAKLFFF